ncbi:hypothetical protein RCOM_0865620 [Ricinus communis]|uniref:Uncharacterized protein n=1 Tax=Ricinus communis TaxID=3988 RepID=B9S1K2_RICCO|nr:hypothetical protein RCOM_0865620 [Ricinus communis]
MNRLVSASLRVARTVDMEGARSDVVLMMDQENTKSQSVELKDRTPTREEKSLNTARPISRLSFSKPKARFLEHNYPNTQKPYAPSNDRETLLEEGYSWTSDEDDEDDDDEWNEANGERRPHKYQKKKRKTPWRLLVEWVLFLAILICLICSLTVKTARNKLTWGIEIWKWCLMVMLTFCGRLVSGWVMGFAVFLIERNFMLREKIVLVKMLASSFHVATYFDRMKESVFHHYILDALSGPPMEEVVLMEEQQHRNLTAVGSKSLPVSWKQGRWKEARTKATEHGEDSFSMEYEEIGELCEKIRIVNNYKNS